MNAYIIMLLVAFAIFAAYTITVFCTLGIPESYSNTFYLYNEKKKGLGFIFPAMSASIVALVMPGWLALSDVVLPNFTFLSFFSAAGLLFVAASPFFKECARDTGHKLADLIYKSFHGQGLIHTIGALTAMIGTVTWIAMTCVWIVLPIILVITIIVALCTRSFLKSATFWAEFFIFMAMFIGLGTLHFIVML